MPEVQGNLAKALTGLEAARGMLETGKGDPRATRSLEDAVQSLQGAAQALAVAALEDAGKITPASGDQGEAESEQTMGTPAGSTPGAAGGGGAGGGGGGRLARQKKAAHVRDDLLGPQGEEWDGAEGRLGSDDRKGRKMQYTDYYRKATQRYFEEIRRASREAGE